MFECAGKPVHALYNKNGAGTPWFNGNAVPVPEWKFDPKRLYLVR